MMELNLRRSQESKDKPQKERARAFHDEVNEERDRRILRGFDFMGRVYAFDAQSALDIAGAGATALEAIMRGAQEDDLYWSDPEVAFVWRAMNNEMVSMDAKTTWAFSQKARKHRQVHVYAAARIKDAETPPLNWRDDEHWPAIV